MDGPQLVSPGQVAELYGRYTFEIVGGRVKVIPLPAPIRIEEKAKRGKTSQERIGLTLPPKTD